MNSKKNILLCAPETLRVMWIFISWDTIKRRVKSLQQRITKAINMLPDTNKQVGILASA